MCTCRRQSRPFGGAADLRCRKTERVPRATGGGRNGRLAATKETHERYRRNLQAPHGSCPGQDVVAEEDGNLHRQAELQPRPHQGGGGREEARARRARQGGRQGPCQGRQGKDGCAHACRARRSGRRPTRRRRSAPIDRRGKGAPRLRPGRRARARSGSAQARGRRGPPPQRGGRAPQTRTRRGRETQGRGRGRKAADDTRKRAEEEASRRLLFSSRREASSSARLRACSSAALRASSSALRFSAAARSRLRRSSSSARLRASSSARLRASTSCTRASARAAPRRAFSSSVNWRRTTPARWPAAGAAGAAGAGAAVFACASLVRPLSAALPGSTRARFFSTTTALVRPWLKLCLTVEVSVFFSDSVLDGARPVRRVEVSSVSLMRLFRCGQGSNLPFRPPPVARGTLLVLRNRRSAAPPKGRD